MLWRLLRSELRLIRRRLPCGGDVPQNSTRGMAVRRFWNRSVRAERHFRVEDCRTAVRLESYVEGYKKEIEDRAEIVRLEDRLILMVADGAGGRPGGARAAEQTAAFVRRTAITAHHPCATCAMGNGEDAVLDPSLRVRGVSEA